MKHLHDDECECCACDSKHETDEIRVEYINPQGLAEIESFLNKHHKQAPFTPAQISAWATDAEFQLAEGNEAMVSISSKNTFSGEEERYYVSWDGISFHIYD